MRDDGAVVGVAVSTAIMYAVEKSSLPDTLPARIRQQVIDGTWHSGQSGVNKWDNVILDAKMKGLHAVFAMTVLLIGLCLLGCAFVPNVVLQGDDNRNTSTQREAGTRQQ